MSVMKTVELDRYRWLAGLGEADTVPPTDQFEGWNDLAAKRAAQAELRKAILAGDDAIYGARREMPGFLNALKVAVASGVLGPIATIPLAITKLIARDTQARIDQAVNDRVESWELTKKYLWEAANAGTITFEGKTRSLSPNEAQKLIETITKQVRSMQTAVQLADETTTTALLTSGVGRTVTGILDIFKKAYDVLASIGNAVAALAKGGATAISWLPVIIVAAIAVPFVLRVFVAGKRGGATAAAEEAAGQIERGRSLAAEGARSAARRVSNAVASRNPGALFSGSPKRRRRK